MHAARLASPWSAPGRLVAAVVSLAVALMVGVVAPVLPAWSEDTTEPTSTSTTAPDATTSTPTVEVTPTADVETQPAPTDAPTEASPPVETTPTAEPTSEPAPSEATTSEPSQTASATTSPVPPEPSTSPAESAGPTAAVTPTIASDLADYQPGATVTLTGAGWLPDTSVRVVVNDTFGSSWKRDVVVPVDAEGIVTDAFSLPTWFVSAYDVTATGDPSGRVAVAAFTDAALPASVSLTNWETKNGGDWVTATLAANNSDYAEGETVPYRIELGSLTSGQTYYAPICRDYANSATGPYGYTTLLPFDTSRPATAGGTITSSSGAFSGVGITIGQVYDAAASSGTLDGNTFSCGSTQRLVIVKFVSLGGSGQYLLWGGRLSAPGDTNPFVAYGNSSSSYTGGSLQMRLASPDKTGGINPGAIVILARLSVTKVVDAGTTPPDAWSFTVVGPDGYNRTLDVPDGQSTVQFLGLQTGTYTVTESDVPGYAFASGSGTSCTFTGSTATAGVVASTGAPTNATCTFHNALVNASIDVEKSVWDGSAWQDADAAAGPYLLGPAAPVFRFVVTNTGDATLSSVQLSDSPTIADFYGDQALTTACEPPTELAPAATFTCYGSLPWAAGQQSDTATATGSFGGSTYTDTDPAYYVGAAPAIDIQKTPDTQVVVAGSTATFTILVTNTGNVLLTSVSVTDPLAPSCEATIGPLAVGGSTSYQCTTVNLFTGFTNTASVTGTYGGTTVTDTDDAVVSVDVLPDITTVKTANPTEVPETGGDVTFTVDVTNNSSEDFTLGSLVDDRFGSLDGVGTCDVPQTITAEATYTCTFTKALASDTLTPHTDTVTASGVDPQGHPDSDDDDATVTFTDVPPSLDVTKTADPSTVPETGGDVAFTFRVHNTSTSESVTIASLTDSVYGTLAGDADCQVGTVLAADGACEFTTTAWVAGDSSEPDHVNVFTAHATDNENTDVSDSDDATVDLSNVAPTIEVTKSVDPTEVPETGGSVTLTFTVRNTSPGEAVEITSLEDSLLGGLAGDVDCSVGTWLSGVTIDPVHATCTFQVTTGLAGDAAGPDHVNTFTAHAEDNDGTDAWDDDDATVGFSDAAPSVAITKTADPLELPEPGGEFTFTLSIRNTSSESVTITDLTDTNPLSTECSDLEGDVLAPDQIVTCTYTVTHADAGTYVNTASVTVTDNDGTTAVASDDETVTVTDVLPTVDLTKTASPTTLAEPGGVFTFTLSIHNTSPEPVTIEALGDTNALSAECIALVGTSIPADGTVTCTYEVAHTDAGTYSNTASVTVSDNDGHFVPDTDDETVTVSDVLPTVELTKSASPSTSPEPGGAFTFTLSIHNTSSESVTITALSDDNALSDECLALIDEDLAVDETVSCSYTVTHTNAGTYPNTAEVTVADNEDNPASDTDNAEVTVTDVGPTVDLTKSASPATLPEPGGVFTFTLDIENTSVEPVMITALSDANALSEECLALVGTSLAAGASTSCTYTVTHTEAGSYDNTAGVAVADDDGNAASDFDDETVTVVDVGPTVELTKSASPTTLAEPGGVFTFTLSVHNTSSESVTITDLTDTNTLSTECTDLEGDVLAPDETVTCTYAVTHTDAGTYENTASVTVADNEGGTASDTDDETVTVTDVLPTVELTKSASPTTLPEPGGVFTFTLSVHNTSSESVTITDLTDTNPVSTECTDLEGDVLAPDETVTCTYAVTHTDAGTYENTASVTVADNEGGTASDTDDETVTVTDVLPTVELTKSASPTTLPEPGGVFTFTLSVHNTSSESVTITDLTDTNPVSTECADLEGDVLAPDETVTCTYAVTRTDGGTYENTAEVTVADNEGGTASDTDDETVAVVDVLPSVELTKSASPSTLAEPGGVFTFTLDIANTSVESVTVTALSDDNALSAECLALVGTSLGAGASTSCTYTVTHTEAGSYDNSAGVAVADDDGNAASDFDDETVTVTDVLPTVVLDKSVNVTTFAEPGGIFTFTLRIENTSVEPVTITALTDDNALSHECQELVGTVLGVGGSVTCTYEVEHTDAGVYDNTATVTVADGEGNAASASDNESVSITDTVPTFTVEKSADPTSVPESGGFVDFTFEVTGTSMEPVAIASIVDDVFGPLAGDADCQVGTILWNGASCTFTLADQWLTGEPSSGHTNTVTVTATDDEGNTPTASDDATVAFTDVLPEVAVTKTADPSTVPETGGDVTFTFVVTNTGADEAVTVTELSDDVLGALTGDADCQVGTVLAAGASCDFSMTEWLEGDAATDAVHTNVFTAAVEDNEGNPATDTDDETVTLTDVAPTISVTKTANPTEVPETGGDVVFTVVVTNTSADETVEIVDLVDDTFGLLDGDDDCAIGLSLAAGASCELTFTEHLQGEATTTHTDVVSVYAVDNEGTTASASDDAVVTFTDVAPTLRVAKTAMPNALPETGGDADFHFVVTNTAPEAVTITALTDDVFGTLSGDADCKVGTVLQVGGSCAFDLLDQHLVGDVATAPTHTDVFTATVVDNEETPATAFDDAVVTFTDVLPVIEVTKTANPTSVPETGQAVTFTVVVDNPGTEAVIVTSLTDDVFGDLLDPDNPDVDSTTCTTAALTPGATYTCTFTAFVGGDFEASYGNVHEDWVTVEVADNEGNTASDTDDAVVELTDVDPRIDVEKYVSTDGGATWKDADSPTGPVVTAGSAVKFRFVVTNPGDVTVRLTLADSVYTLAGCVVPATLAGHAAYTCTLSTTAVAGQHVDTATATGSITDGAGNVERATDTDKAHYLGTANTGALTMGYWQNKNGQSIISSGASTSGVCRSATWLRQYKPFQDLSSTASCAKVAAYVVTVVKAANASGASMNAMLKGQMLATALNVYFSNASLGGNKIGAPAPIGDRTVDLTLICTDLTCTAFENASTAFGGTPRTVSQMLTYAASQASAGGSSWYGQVKATQELAKDAFDALNNRKVVIVP